MGGKGRQTGRESGGIPAGNEGRDMGQGDKEWDAYREGGEDNYSSGEGDGTGRNGDRQRFQQVKKQDMQVRRESLTNYRQGEEGGSGG